MVFTSHTCLLAVYVHTDVNGTILSLLAFLTSSGFLWPWCNREVGHQLQRQCPAGSQEKERELSRSEEGGGKTPQKIGEDL